MTEVHKWPPAKKAGMATCFQPGEHHIALCLLCNFHIGPPILFSHRKQGPFREEFHCTILIQRINLHRSRGKDQVKTGGYVSNNCHIADTWQDWSCSSKSMAELCFGGFDFIPTARNCNVLPYLKIIFEKGLLTSGLVPILQGISGCI